MMCKKSTPTCYEREICQLLSNDTVYGLDTNLSLLRDYLLEDLFKIGSLPGLIEELAYLIGI